MCLPLGNFMSAKGAFRTNRAPFQTDRWRSILTSQRISVCNVSAWLWLMLAPLWLVMAPFWRATAPLWLVMTFLSLGSTPSGGWRRPSSWERRVFVSFGGAVAGTPWTSVLPGSASWRPLKKLATSPWRIRHDITDTLCIKWVTCQVKMASNFFFKFYFSSWTQEAVLQIAEVPDAAKVILYA